LADGQGGGESESTGGSCGAREITGRSICPPNEGPPSARPASTIRLERRKLRGVSRDRCGSSGRREPGGQIGDRPRKSPGATSPPRRKQIHKRKKKRR